MRSKRQIPRFRSAKLFLARRGGRDRADAPAGAERWRTLVVKCSYATGGAHATRPIEGKKRQCRDETSPSCRRSPSLSCECILSSVRERDEHADPERAAGRKDNRSERASERERDTGSRLRQRKRERERNIDRRRTEIRARRDRA